MKSNFFIIFFVEFIKFLFYNYNGDSMIKCPNCTGELNFKPGDNVVKCEYCGTTWNPAKLKEKVVSAKKEEKSSDEAKNVETISGDKYTCTQCGAELLTFDETAVTFCSYCGSQALIEDKMYDITKPDYIIPFSKTKEDCIKAYKKTFSKALFVPNYMKDNVVLDKFRGIYLPYCVYKLSHSGKCVNKGSVRSHRSGDYVYYKLYDITADVDASYNGISFDLVSKYYDSYSHSIPFDYRGVKEFNENYLLGYYSDVLDVESSVYNNNVKDIAEKDSTKYLKKNKTYFFHGCSDPIVRFEIEEKKIGMFPVYFLAVKDKKNDKNVHYAIVNGQTGKVAADLPIDFKKYIIGSLIITPFIFLLINFNIVLTPKTISVISIFFGIVSMAIIGKQGQTLREKETHENDLGFKSINNIEKKKESYFPWKPLVSIFLPIVLLLINFVNDMYYYTGVIISLGFVVWTFKDIIDRHNIMVSNKLPQLNKRGGDESE